MNTQEVFAKLREDPANKICVDCGAANPQWASECSGQHRGLGVHIRSVTMDSWSEKQLRRMMVGGNGPFSNFLRQHGIAGNTPIREKYNTKVAEVYRDKISSLAEGKEWKAPAAIPKTQSPSVPAQNIKKSSSTPETRSESNRPKQDVPPKRKPLVSSGNGEEIVQQDQEDDGWGSNEDFRQPSKSKQPEYNTYNAPKMQGQRSISSEDYYPDTARKAEEDDVMKYIESGWSKLSVAAKSATQIVVETSKTAAQKISESGAKVVNTQDMGTTVTELGTKVIDAGGKGWNLLSGYINKAKDSVMQLSNDLMDQSANAPQQQQQQQQSVTYNGSQSGYNTYNAQVPSSGKPGHSSNSRSEETEDSKQDLEDWLNDDKPKKTKKKPSIKKPEQSTAADTSDGWDNWNIVESETPAPGNEPSPSPPQQQKQKSKVEEPTNNDTSDGWDDWNIVESETSSDVQQSKKPSKKKKSKSSGNESSTPGWENWDNQWS